MLNLLLNVLTVVVTVSVPMLTPYLINFIKSHVHSNDVAIYMEAAVNAAGRVILNANTAYKDGSLTKGTLADFLNNQVKMEAARIVNEYLPQTVDKLGKSPDDVAEVIRAKIGTQLDKLPLPNG